MHGRVLLMADDKYISDSQQRILQFILALAGNEIEGLAKGQIAKLIDCSPSQVTRDFENLRHLGLAEEITSTGRVRLGPALVQIAIKHSTALNRAQTRLDEITNRFSRGTDS